MLLKVFKRFTSVFLSITLIFSLSSIALSADGETLRLVNGYYEIHSAEDLAELSERYNDPQKVVYYSSANYKLCADIDMNGAELSLMASTTDTAFTGSFIGEDKFTISNMTITGTKTVAGASAVGLFCYANGATFSNFALRNVTVNNPGTGTGLVVGYADASSDTSCKFNNIDIDNCTVNSTYTGVTMISLTNMAEAGALVGSVRSTSAESGYEFRNITVTNTTVKNTNTGGSYAIGGLIGSSCTAGTLVIGTPEAVTETEPSIVIDNVELNGYGFMGGIIGIAGGLPNTTSTNSLASTATGGITINNVIVKNSAIPARQGYSGGILGTEGCVAGGAKIINSKVENTTVSAGATAAVTSTVADAGGIAGHMAGLIENCTVDSCTVKSCFAGGILGRSSRRGNTDEGTLVTIKNCNVIGETEITDNGVGIANELGGIIANARTCSALIEKCGAGTDVHIHGTADYAGGIMGACLFTATTALYDVTIKDSISYATVEIEAANTTSAAGAIIGLGNMNVAFLDIINCVAAGEVNCNGGYCGGVIGFYNRTAKGTAENATLIVDCTVTALLNVNSNGIEEFTNNVNNTAKLVGRTGTFNANYWMGNTLTDAVNGNIISSYPQDIRVYGYAGSYDLQARNTNYVNTFTDVNKPDGRYISGEDAPIIIDGSVNDSVNIFICNESEEVADKLTFDTEASEYNGWQLLKPARLTINGFESATEDCAAYFNVSATMNTSFTGITGNYYLPGITVPGTDEKAMVPVMIPVVCTNITGGSADVGDCGDNVNWLFNESTQELVIYGTGAMHNWDEHTDATWYYLASQIKSVCISDGVTSIGKNAFYALNKLELVTIPDSVTSIGEYAFDYCTSLREIKISQYLTNIADGSFYYCLALENIAVSQDNPNYSSDDYGVLFNKDKTQLLRYTTGNSRQSYVIPESVTTIGSSAFRYCADLEAVTIPYSVTVIEYGAFGDATALKSVTYNGTQSMWDQINIKDENQPLLDAEITIEHSHTEGEWEILTEATIYSKGTKVKKCTVCSTVLQTESIPIKPSEEGSCGDNLTWQLFSDGELVISGTGAMTNWTDSSAPWHYLHSSINKVTIGNSVESIGECAFEDCDDLTSITIGDSVKNIGGRAFYSCETLTSITIPDSVESIGSTAFWYCSSLKSITIPDSVKIIGELAFTYCYSLTDITVDKDNSFYSSDEYGVLFNKDKTELIQYPLGNKRTSYTIPGSVTEIGYWAFVSGSVLASVTIPDSVTVIGDCAFWLCSGLKDVYYTGTEEEWNEISIGMGNQVLANATIHFADPKPDDTQKASFTVSSGKVHPGETVEITVDVANNPGIVAAKISLNFDSELVTLTDVRNGGIFADSDMTKGSDLTKQPYAVLWSDALSETNYTSDGTLVTFVFTASAEAPECKVSINIEYDPDSTFDAGLDNVEFTLTGGEVEITNRVPGDPDGDGEVTLKDAVIIERYLADWDVTIVDVSNADVDSDGILTLKDVVLIERYLADWDVELI